jgi:seryl-tRNA synthetase
MARESTAARGDQSIGLDPIDQLNRLNLSEPVPSIRAKNEIIRALQSENQQLRTENKRLGADVGRWKNISEQRKNALLKSGEEMDAMNNRLFKLSKVETQLKKLQNVVGEALEPVEENRGEDVVENSAEGEGAKGSQGKRGGGKGAKREVGDGDDEMGGFRPSKRVRVDG